MARIKTEWDDEIARLDDELDILREKKRAVMQKRAEFLCPFKVGDVIVSQDGKRKGEVVKISPDWSGRRVRIRRILKSGKLGVQTYEVGTWDWDLTPLPKTEGEAA